MALSHFDKVYVKDGFSHATETSKRVLLPVIKRQQRIRNCVAVSMTEAMGALSVVEGLYPFHIPLSSQEIFDNLIPPRNYSSAAQYIQQYGICRAVDYPYRGEQRTPGCTDRFQKHKIKEFWKLETSKDEEKILAAIRRSPIVGVTYVSQPLKDLTPNEIFDAEERDLVRNAHAVLITGYATIGGIPCYEIKNSWGIGWGAKGYGILARRTIPRVIVMRSAYIEPPKIPKVVVRRTLPSTDSEEEGPSAD